MLKNRPFLWWFKFLWLQIFIVILPNFFGEPLPSQGPSIITWDEPASASSSSAAAGAGQTVIPAPPVPAKPSSLVKSSEEEIKAWKDSKSKNLKTKLNILHGSWQKEYEDALAVKITSDIEAINANIQYLEEALIKGKTRAGKYHEDNPFDPTLLSGSMQRALQKAVDALSELEAQIKTKEQNDEAAKAKQAAEEAERNRKLEPWRYDSRFKHLTKEGYEFSYDMRQGTDKLNSGPPFPGWALLVTLLGLSAVAATIYGIKKYSANGHLDDMGKLLDGYRKSFQDVLDLSLEQILSNSSDLKLRKLAASLQGFLYEYKELASFSDKAEINAKKLALILKLIDGMQIFINEIEAEANKNRDDKLKSLSNKFNNIVSDLKKKGYMPIIRSGFSFLPHFAWPWSRYAQIVAFTFNGETYRDIYFQDDELAKKMKQTAYNDNEVWSDGKGKSIAKAKVEVIMRILEKLEEDSDNDQEGKEGVFRGRSGKFNFLLTLRGLYPDIDDEVVRKKQYIATYRGFVFEITDEMFKHLEQEGQAYLRAAPDAEKLALERAMVKVKEKAGASRSPSPASSPTSGLDAAAADRVAGDDAGRRLPAAASPASPMHIEVHASPNITAAGRDAKVSSAGAVDKKSVEALERKAAKLKAQLKASQQDTQRALALAAKAAADRDDEAKSQGDDDSDTSSESSRSSRSSVSSSSSLGSGSASTTSDDRARAYRTARAAKKKKKQ